MCATIGWALPAGYTEGRYIELGDCYLIVILELILCPILTVNIVICVMSKMLLRMILVQTMFLKSEEMEKKAGNKEDNVSSLRSRLILPGEV